MKSAIYIDSQGRNATVKKVAARIDYPFDFNDLVEYEGAAIVSYTVAVAGITKVADAQVDNVIFVTVEGGTVGLEASIKVLVTLGDSQGNKFPLDLYLKIES
jgi:hypothetical protein